MHEIDGESAPNKRFIDGSPLQNGTIVTADWLNIVQDELCNLIKLSGIDLNLKDTDDGKQVFSSVHKIVNECINEYSNKNNYGVIIQKLNDISERVSLCEKQLKDISTEKK